jgi:hypothetical protein
LDECIGQLRRARMPPRSIAAFGRPQRFNDRRLMSKKGCRIYARSMGR